MIDPQHASASSTAPDCPPAGPRVRKKRGYRRSGFYALKTTLRALGPRVLDKRTSLGKQLAAWKADLIADLGGDPSTGQRAVIELAMRTKLLLDSIDAWLLTQPSLVNARKRALLPVVRERQALADALARYLVQLGLERRIKAVPDLKTYLATTATEGAGSRDREAGGHASSPISPAPSNTDGPEADVGDSNP